MQFLIDAFINWHVRVWHIHKLGFEDQFLKQTEHINYCDKRQTDISFRCGKTFLSYKNLSKQLHFSWTLCSVMCDLQACWTCVQPLLSQWRPMDPILNLIEGSSRGNFCQCWWLSESFLISEVIVGSKFCQTCGREAGPKTKNTCNNISICLWIFWGKKNSRYSDNRPEWASRQKQTSSPFKGSKTEIGNKVPALGVILLSGGEVWGLEIVIERRRNWKFKVMSTSPTIPASSAAATTTAATPTSAASGQNLNVDRWHLDSLISQSLESFQKSETLFINQRYYV